ncbi:MAG: hypothetical protein K8S00_06430, partial [Bacteroidales bacterium]|nr:hypothetical protein [Bacteroidales bacterium]
MVRLEYLKVNDHPQLGDLELFFSEKTEIKNDSSPYTSVMIGPNGSGKSFILRTIAEIFRQIQTYSILGKKEFNLPFYFQIRYWYNNNIYEIVSTSSLPVLQRIKREYYSFKNRPIGTSFFKNVKNFDRNTEFSISKHQIKFPEKILVNSTIPTDRFVYRKSNPSDFYQYLGV